MSKGRQIVDYLADILTAIVEVDDFIHGNSRDSLLNSKGG